MVPSTRFQIRLVAARALSPSVRELTFRRVDEAPMEFAPGQWINLLGDGELKRSYSIASAPRGIPELSLAVTRVIGGPMSERLHALELGAELTAVGPQGLFSRAADDARAALFVGTGTGVAPLRSMIHAALAAGSVAPLTLLFGARHEADVLYRDELDALAAAHPNFRWHVTLSQPEPSWSGRRGWVQTHLAELARAAGLPDVDVYVCGLERMVKAVKELARGELALDRKRFHQEKYD